MIDSASLNNRNFQIKGSWHECIYHLFLFISFQIPIHFDILSYLKKAWCSGRLVLTIPWAVEYLSMMDPVAPLLDYFSMVLNFLYMIYRFLHSSLLTKEMNAQIEKTRKHFICSMYCLF